MKKFVDINLLVDVGLGLTVVIVALIIQVVISKKAKRPKKNYILYSEYIDIAQTGDLVFFSSDLSDLRLVLRYPWNHVGIVIRDPVRGALLWESNILGDSAQDHHPVDLVSKKSKDGTQLLYLKDKLDNYKGIVSFRRLESKYRRENTEKEWSSKLLNFSSQFGDVKFRETGKYWAPQFFYMRNLLPFGPPEKLSGSIFDIRQACCSEICALALREIGALKNTIQPHEVTPVELHKGRGSSLLNQGWSFGPTVYICAKK